MNKIEISIIVFFIAFVILLFPTQTHAVLFWLFKSLYETITYLIPIALALLVIWGIYYYDNKKDNDEKR